MTPVRYSDHVDPGGKPVDIIATPRRLCVCSYVPSSATARATVLATTVELLGRLSASGTRRMRERELTLWWGETSSDGEPLRVVGFPDRLAYGVHQLLEPLIQLGSRRAFGDFEFADTGAAPLAGYDHGRIVAYTDAFAAPGSINGAELRSAELLAPRVTAARRGAIPRLPAAHGPTYSLAGWAHAGTQVIDAIGDLFSAGTYTGLRRLVATDLHIAVTERTGGDFPAYGRLRVGWLTEAADGDPGCAVQIDVRADIAIELRYVVLAHELAHFLLHFPLLFAAQLVEQATWELPELEPVWQAKLRAEVPSRWPGKRRADVASALT